MPFNSIFRLITIHFRKRNEGYAPLLFLVITVILAINGCKPVGPDYMAPSPKLPDTWSNQIELKLEQKPQSDIENWWTIFNDTVLNALIEQANLNNKNLKIAYSRVLQARAGLSGIKGEKYPYAGIGGEVSVNKMSDNGALAPVAPEGGFSPHAYTRAGISASWEIDVFGRVRRSMEAASANFQANVEDYYDMLVILYADVAMNYLNIRINQQRIRNASQNIVIQQNMVDLTRDRYNAGLTSYLDVVQATSNLYYTKATIPQFEIEVNKALNNIAVLTGVTKDSLMQNLFRPGEIPIPDSLIAAGIPANVLRQRPDIRAAERRIAMYNAKVGVNTADLYPTFNLSGFFGLATGFISSWFPGSSFFWGASFPIQWQIFNRAGIKANIAISNEQTRQALFDYENTVLEAVAEVDNSMVSFNELEKQQHYLQQAVASSKEAVSLVAIQYDKGLTDFQNVLDTQRTLFKQQDRFIESRGAAMLQLVGLYKALGGGWTLNRPDFNTLLNKK